MWEPPNGSVIEESRFFNVLNLSGSAFDSPYFRDLFSVFAGVGFLKFRRKALPFCQLHR